jgi:hypothetical protein
METGLSWEHPARTPAVPVEELATLIATSAKGLANVSLVQELGGADERSRERG